MAEKRELALDEHGRSTLSLRDQLVLSCLWLALNIQSAALLPIVIPTQILLYISPGAAGNAQQAIFLGWLSALGAIAALILQPVVGALSDITPGPWGRRRPYILLGGAVMLAGTLALGLVRAVAAFVAAFVLVNVGTNIATAAYQSLLPDRVPPEQRGAASGYMGLMTILGNVGSLAIAALLLGAVGGGETLASDIERGALIFYVLAGVVLIVGVAVTLAGVPDPPLERPPSRPRLARVGMGRHLRRWVVDIWIEPWHHGNFAWVFLTRCFVMMGLTLFMTFIEYYFANVAQVSDFVQQTAAVAVLALLGAVASALVLGMLSDHTSRVPVVCVSTLLMTLAAAVFVIAPDALPLWPLGIVFGLGYGEFFGPTGVVPVLWVSPMDQPTTLLLGGVALGVVLLGCAYALGTVNRVREGGWAAALYAPSGIAGSLLFVAAGVGALAWYSESTALAVAAGLLAVMAIGLAFAGFWASAGRGAAGLLQAFIEVFDMVLRLGSNIVSFARLAAFGLTHAVLGWIVWQAATGLWEGGPLGKVAGVAVFAAGNALAFALEALVAAVQALRLEYYELFSRVFQTQGRPFQPWRLPVERSGREQS